MNKGDLINKVAEGAGITKAQATAAVNSVFDSIQDAVKANDKAAFVGLVLSVWHTVRNVKDVTHVQVRQSLSKLRTM